MWEITISTSPQTEKHVIQNTTFGAILALVFEVHSLKIQIHKLYFGYKRWLNKASLNLYELAQQIRTNVPDIINNLDKDRI